MQVKMFAAYDVKAEAFMTPFTASTEATAIRGFCDAFRNPEHPFAQHPADYSLFYLGDFDQVAGNLSPAKMIRTVFTGLEVNRMLRSEAEAAIPDPVSEYADEVGLNLDELGEAAGLSDEEIQCNQ